MLKAADPDVRFARAPVRWIAARLRGRADSEHEQALVRLALGLVAGVYIVWSTQAAASLPDAARTATLWLCGAFLAVSVALFAWIVLDPAVRPLRRILGIVGDNVATGAVLWVDGKLAAPLFVVFLWVAFGNGFRFGLPYLAGSATLAVGVFVIGASAHDLWRQEPYWSGGILVALIVLPAYAAVLLRSLHDALRRAEAAGQAKLQFLANISHEIRTPLHGIVGLNELLIDTGIDGQRRRYAELVRQSATWLLEIVNDVLDFSKIEAGFFDIEHAAFDLRRVVSDVVGLHGEPSRQKGLEVSASVDERVPQNVVGDGLRIARVLNNLVNNAVKFTDRGRVTVRVAAVEVTETAATVAFEVADTGIGIAPEAVERIFEPFFQADGSTTRKYGGTGLGLAISRRLVERLGGALQVDSAPGRGTTFRFTVTFERPVPSAESAAAKAHEPESPAGEFRPSRVRGARVLAVEDNPLNLELLARFLHRFGCEVHLASNGREAMEARRKFDPDVILMDCQMPEMDGYAATEAIRIAEAAAGPGSRRVPIVALTAHASPDDRQRCLAAGMDDYLAKPFRPSALLGTLERWVTPAAPTLRPGAPQEPAGTSTDAPAGPAAPPVPPAARSATRQLLHDVNNQLLVVVGHAELLLDSLAHDAAERQQLESILEAGHRAARLVSAESARLRSAPADKPE